MRQFRLNILRLQQVKRQTSDKCTELRLRLLIICTLELRRGVIILIAVVVVIQIGTMWREGLQFVKSAVFHLRLLRLGNYFCFWTRTEVSFDPILSYFQESAGDWICKVYCMLYNGTFYTGFIRRFSTSPAKNCFVNFFYCRYVRGLDFSGLWWDAMTFWIALHCIDCTTYWTKTPYWPLIERGCENPTWYSAERSVTLHSFDFTKYRLWTSLFRRGTIVNGQIVVCSFDLTEYHLWKIYFWMFFDALWSIDHFMTLNEHNRHCGCTRLVL